MVRFFTCCLAGLLGLTGCQSSTHRAATEWPANATTASTQSELGPGDVVEVSFSYTPELNRSQPIRPDGTLQLPLIGSISADGLTCRELRMLLLELYEPELKDPDIVVTVPTDYNRRVYVGGQVLQPGVLPMPGGLTVLEAISEAGGFQHPQAYVRNVVVIRFQNGQRYGYRIDLGSSLEGDESTPFYLKPKDIVYVPRTPIAKVGQWVDQYINGIIPKTGFLFTYSGDNTTIGIDTSTR